MKQLVMMDGLNVIISDEQAEKIEKVSVSLNPPKMLSINGNMINLNSISSISEYHEPKAVEKKALPAATGESKYREQWLEATKRNKQLLLNKQKPVWWVRDGEVVEAPEEFTSYDRLADTPVRAHSETLDVSQREYARYYAGHSAYKKIDSRDNHVTIEFTQAGEDPLSF